MIKNTWTQKYTHLAIFIAILSLVVIWMLYKHSSLPKRVNNDIRLPFKQFTLIIPADYVLFESPDYSPDIYAKVKNSSLADESGCVRVENIQTAILQKNTPVDIGSATWYPVLEIQSWSNKDLKYLDEETKIALNQRLSFLAELSNHNTFDLAKRTTDSFQTDRFVPAFHPWEGYLSCAGIYSLPSFIERQAVPPQSNWNEIYYGEVYEGNGDTFGPPLRVVIARQNDAWILVKEQQAYPPGYKSTCPIGNLSLDEYNCAKAEWGKTRNPAIYRTWVQQVLAWVQ